MKILNIKEVMKLTTLSRTLIWELETKGQFPGRISLTERRVAWIEQEVLDWIASRPRFPGNNK